MKARSYMVAAGVAACTLISCVLLSERNKESARREKADVTAAQLRQEIAAAREKLRLRSGPFLSPPIGSKPPVTSKVSAHPPWEAPDLDKQIGQHPELQNLRIEATRALIRTRYQPLFDRLHLSPEQVSAFAENMANDEERQVDVRAALAAQGFPLNGPEAQKFYGESMTEFQNAQKKLLGESGYAEWTEYERGVFFRQFTADAAAVATVRGAELSPIQLEKLKRALLDSSRGYASGGYATPVDIDWKTLEAKVGTFVSPEQKAAIFSAHNSSSQQSNLRAVIAKAVADQGDRNHSR